MEPIFVQTENVKNLIAFMAQIHKRVGHDSLGLISGPAGRGKTCTAKWYATQNECVYVESLRDWSSLWMFQNICRAMGIAPIPGRKKAAFEAIVEASTENPRPIILDEADLIGSRLIESVRDLCKVMMVPWVLVGEESLPELMRHDRRVWSRTYVSMEFKPMQANEIIYYAHKAAGLKVPADCADLIQRKSSGDIRLVGRTVGMLETICNANRTNAATLKITKAAISKGLQERSK